MLDAATIVGWLEGHSLDSTAYGESTNNQEPVTIRCSFPANYVVTPSYTPPTQAGDAGLGRDPEDPPVCSRRLSDACPLPQVDERRAARFKS